MSNEKIKILFIGVNYHSDSFALKLIKSLNTLNQEGVEMQIIVVDNTERTESNDFFNQAKSMNQKVICLKSPNNLGYFGGARLGLETYLKTNHLPEWIIVANVDLEFSDPMFLQNLIRSPKIESLGIIAPAILHKNSFLDKNPFMTKRPSKKRMNFYQMIFNSYYLTRIYEFLALIKNTVRCLYQKIIFFFKPSKEIRQIYAPHGSCLIFSKNFFLNGGNLNYPSFLFGEEMFIAETALKLGLKVIYNPNLKLWHIGHISIGKFLNQKLLYFKNQSINYLINRYFK